MTVTTEYHTRMVAPSQDTSVPVTEYEEEAWREKERCARLDDELAEKLMLLAGCGS